MSITESQESLTSPHCYYWSSHSLCPLHPHKQPLMLVFSLFLMISLGLIQSSSHTELLQNRRCSCWGAAVLFNPNSAWAQTNQAEGIKGGGGDQYSSMLPPHAKPKSLKENINRRARKCCVSVDVRPICPKPRWNVAWQKPKKIPSHVGLILRVRKDPIPNSCNTRKGRRKGGAAGWCGGWN